MLYRRSPIEIESPEQFGYDRIRHNLAESSIRDATLGEIVGSEELDDLVLRYGDHLGHSGLRGLVAATGEGLRPEEVLLTPGAVAALFIIHTALLGRGDHIVVIRPNYSTNLDTPRAVAADIGIVDLTFESGWAIDPERLSAAMRPDTKLVSITVPHNPTGATLDVATLLEIVRRVERSGARLLVDETYREMTLGGPLPVAATLSDRVISVSSVSKTYGLPGLRTGWLITRDADWFERFLAAKEQMLISGSVVDEELTYRALRRRTERLPAILADIRQRLGIAGAWIDDEPALEWVRPRGGVVGFPRIRAEAGVDVERFYDRLAAAGTAVGPGHWFEQPRSHFRLGYGWPTDRELEAGLASISSALADARR